MENLISLAQLVNGFKTNNKLSEDKRFDNKSQQLYNGLLNGRYTKDDDAFKEIYGNEAKRKAYQKLKERFRQEMASQLISNNLARHFYNNYSNAKYRCMSTLFASTVLAMKGKKESATELSENALGLAENYFFTDLAILSLRFLRYMSTINGDSIKVNKYTKKLNYLKEIYNAELEAEELYNEILFPFIWKSTPQDKDLTIKRIFMRIKSIIAKYDNYNIRLTYYRIIIKYYHMKSLNSKVIEICDDAIKYLNKYKSITPDVWFGEFTLEKMENAMLMKDYKTGSKCAKDCGDYFSKSPVNLIIFKEYYFLLCMHTENYFQAGQLYKETVNKTFNLNTSKAHVEKWKIFRCFLNLVQPVQFKNMRNAYVNPEVFTSSQDKAGYNLALLIAEIVHLLQTDQISKFEIKEDSFAMYVHRHIKKKKFPRSYYFCKMLLTLYKHSLNRKKIIEAASKFERYLQEYKELEHFEVIPYENLWKIILNKLEEKDYEDTTMRRVG